jgi:DNA-binding HxlR family transcriptional regulator
VPLPTAALPLGERSKCPVANALDVVGDRWTLLVVRDLLFFGKVRYNELLGSSERIPTNILADRLRRLQESGIVEKKSYQTRPPRYEYRLTQRGADLLPILREMIVWANRHIAGTGKPPAAFLDRLGAATPGPASASTGPRESGRRSHPVSKASP